MEINCPGDDGSIYAITVTSGNRTINANGGAKGFAPARGVITKILLKVYPGRLNQVPMGEPDPPVHTNPSYTLATVSGQEWCANCIPVPMGGSGSGAPSVYTLFAFGFDVNGTFVRKTFNPFVGQENAGLVCEGCGSGSSCGSATAPSLLAWTLSETAQLEVTIPDGLHAGVAVARPVSSLLWALSIGGTGGEIFVCSTRGLVLRYGSTEVVGQIEYSPFSATFAGEIFQSQDDLVVIIV